jgi:hypothetical protein
LEHALAQRSIVLDQQRPWHNLYLKAVGLHKALLRFLILLIKSNTENPNSRPSKASFRVVNSENNELRITALGIIIRITYVKTFIPKIVPLLIPGIIFAPKNRIDILANPLVHDLQ